MRDSSVVGHYTPYGFLRNAGSGTNSHPKITSNFGQGDPDGENNFTDSNERGGFRFEPPKDFLSLCTANMSDKDYARIGPLGAAGNPDQHFDTALWIGNASSSLRIGGLNFQPDLCITSSRSLGDENDTYDSVRGAGNRMHTDGNESENVRSGVISFNPDGFTVGDHSGVNTNAATYVAWCWKAGNGTVESSDGTIASSVSVNKDAGFSIISYIGTGSNADTVGHGLDKTPDFMILKRRDGSHSWITWHKDLPNTADGEGRTIALDTEVAETDNDSWFYPYIPRAKWFNPGDGGSSNGSGAKFISYAWHSVEGFSKFGGYEGNANADGSFIYLGFRPALVVCKNLDAAGNWEMYTSNIDIYNPATKSVFADATTAEYSSGREVDLLSNGFKQRNTNSNTNSAHTFIYMAWAEMPFKYAIGR